MDEPVNVLLTTPISAHGQPVTALTIRPVKAKDIRLCGYPFIMSKGGEEQRFDVTAITALISHCAGIPPSSVDMMSIVDFNIAMRAVLDFFEGPTPPPSSSLPTTSPGSLGITGA